MNQTEENLRRIRAYNKKIYDAGEWVEEDHPRSKNGQFTSGAGERKSPESPLQKLAAATETPATKNNLKTSHKNGNISLPDIVIGKSVGAKALNYDIVDENTGETFRFTEGSRLQNVEIFAGPGTKTPVHDDGFKERVAKKYDLSEEQMAKMQKVKGVGTIDYNGDNVKAEVHWVQIQGESGKYFFKVKEWLWDEA